MNAHQLPAPGPHPADPADPADPAADAPGRVLFLVRVPERAQREFLDAYQQIRFLVAEGVPGHRRDQVCQSSSDPEQWLITSEWESLADFETWERTPGHRDLVAPMRACFTEARSIRFVVKAETSRRSSGALSGD